MSWLGGSISTITGQLTNFTKDILTEGTEEVSDHVTELHLAQKKIQELENTTLALKSENDWLKKLNKDLEEKAECSELQINSISREYRSVLEFKEKENQLLKQQNHELQEAHINSVVSKDQKSPTLESSLYSNSSNRNSGFVNDELDFGENINLQHEVNRLRSSVQHLQSECKHWKSIASQRSSERGESSQVLADIAELQNKNKELEKQFHTEKERHHDEVSALQNMYYQKITDLKKTYQEKLDSQQTSGNETKDVEREEEKRLKKQLEHSEDEINRLNNYISSIEDKLNLHGTAAKNELGVQKIGETVTAMESDKDEVYYREEKGEGDYPETLESLRKEIADLKNQNLELGKENGNLKKHLEDSKPIVELEGNLSWDHYDELERSSSVLQRVSHRPFEDSSIQSLDENDCQNKHASRSEMQEQMSALQNQVEKYEREIEHFEYLKSDWQLEKEALEDVLMNLRNQLKDKESANNSVHNQKELAEVEQQEKNNDDDISFETAEYLLDKAAASLYPLKMGYLREPRSMNSDEEDAGSDFSIDIEKFDRQVVLLTQANADLEREREYLLQEKHHANDEISYFKDKATSLEEKYSEKVKNEKTLKEKLKEAKHQLAEKDEQIEKLISEKDDVQSSLEELDSQHQEAITQLIDNRHDLAKKVREKSDQIDQLQAELREIQFQLDTANDTISNQRSDLEHSRSHHVSHDQLNELSSEKDKLSNQNEDLKAKLEKAAYVVNELHLDKKELCQKMAEKEEGLKSEIKELAAHNKELELKNSEFQVKLSQQVEIVDTSEMEFRNKCLDKEVQNLKENVKEYAELNRMNEMKLADNEERFTKLIKEIEEIQKENTELVIKCSALREENQLQLKATENKNSKDRFEINHLQQRTDNLSQGLGHVLQDSENPDASLLLESINCTGELLEDYLVNVLEGNVEESSGKLAEHTRTKQVKMCLAYLKARLKDTQEELYISNQNEEHSQIMKEKCEEIEALRTQVLELRKDLVSSMERIQEFEDISNRNQELEDQVETLNHKNLELTNEMSIILSNDSKDSADNHCDPKTLDLITDLESELLSSKNKIKSLEKTVCKFQATSGVAPEKELIKGMVDKNSLNSETSAVLSLQAKVEKDEQELRYFKNILQDISSIIDSEKLQGLNKDVIRYLKQLKAGEFENKSSTGGSEEDVDEVLEKADEIRDPESLKCFSEKKIVSEEVSVQEQSCTAVTNGNAQVEELEKLQQIVSEKDNIIEELQNNNAMLLKMIESKSVSVYGDKSLLELHQLSNDVKDLKLEKEQMISVMDEKTRECSSLKAEVHRLMAIVSEERNAIDHLQHENQQLLQSQNKVIVSNDATDAGGMQKEALQKLSNIIRDKDVEIDALKQKNKTLLTIFQDSSQSGPQINSLIQDKENLKKQLSVLQAERDQIISYLNQKHQESVAYHNEIQRLNAYIQNEAEKYDQLKCEHDQLMPLYEDRNQTLIKTQNELVNYKQKYSELETKYEELLQRSNVSETVDVITYNNKIEEINFLQERLLKVQAALMEQEQKVQGQLHANNDTERNLREIELERNNLKKQYDSVAFQFSELQTQLNEMKTEVASSQRLNEEHNMEIATLKEINNKLSLTIQQKEFELRNVTEKANTVTAMLQKQLGERSELDLLLQESESIRQQAVKFQQERDQVILSMTNLQTEKEEMTKEMQKFKDRNDKQARELERLKMHLLQIEEAYTKEALESEEREKNLRNKLAATEEKAYITAAAVESAGQQSSVQIESLNQQLHAMASQRDNAFLQLSTYQEQCKQYATSLMNLQMVLEQFQAERESQMTAEKQKNEAEQNHLKALIENLQSSLQDTQEKLSEAEDGLQAAERLSEQIDVKMNHIELLKAEVEEKENLLKEADQEIHRLKFDSEAFVDKLVMKNLIINYLSTSQTKKGDVLRLIGGILEFSPEDFSKAEGSFRKSWVLGFFQTSSIPPSVSPKSSPSKFNKSFSELFVNFLEKESSPPPPALRMKTETLEKEVRNKGKAKKESHERNFNPFTAPRHVAMPIPINDHLSTQGQHLLMAPMAPNFPVLSPLTSGSQTNPTQVGLMSSSTILSDVLTQKS